MRPSGSSAIGSRSSSRARSIPRASTSRLRRCTQQRWRLGGYFLVDAKDRDDAIAIAERIPVARRGTVEVRPVIEIPGLPKG
jgi:hypothetical protein